MRTRAMTVAAVTATLTLLLGACASGADPQPAPTAEDGPALTQAPEQPEDAAGSTSAPGARGYLCRYVDARTQEAVAGHPVSDPHQLIVENSRDSWVCEARDGDEALVRVSILRGEGAWTTQRELAQEQDGVSESAEWLGESYESARRVTGLTMCSGGVQGEATFEPYALVVEAVSDADADVSTALTTTASALARALDQTVGCSPRMARGEVPGPTPSS